MKLIFLGPPGAGKGTQAKKLAAYMKIPHISTGDIFRKNIDQRTELGKKASEYIDDGNLVPDDVTNEMVKNRLSEADCVSGYILDGYPRTIEQGKYLGTIQEIENVICFTLDDETIVKRIMSRAEKAHKDGKEREDDKPEVIKTRLAVYREKTQPLIDFYKEKNLLIQIDAHPSIDEIYEDVKEKLSI